MLVLFSCARRRCNCSASNCSPTQIALVGKHICNRRALPLICFASAGCCKIKTSVVQAITSAQAQIQARKGRKQLGQIGRVDLVVFTLMLLERPLGASTSATVAITELTLVMLVVSGSCLFKFEIFYFAVLNKFANAGAKSANSN